MITATPPAIPDEEIYTPAGAKVWFAERGVVIGESFIREQIKAKAFPGYHIGDRFMIPRLWLERWARGEPWNPPAVEPVEKSPIDMSRFLHQKVVAS